MLNDAKTRDLITCDNPKGFGTLQFVKAGAGAGKTTSIKKRVVNFIKHKDLLPEHLVAITYTTKAANNLISGLREELEKELKIKTLDSKHKEKLEKALGTLAYGKVTTFHSFCYDLLREYPIEFKIDPEAEIGDERGQDSIYEACFQQMQEDLLIQDRASWNDHLKSFGELSSLTDDRSILKFFVVLFANRDLNCLDVNTRLDKPTLKANFLTILSDFLPMISRIESEVKVQDDKLVENYRSFIKSYLASFETSDDLALDFLESEKIPFGPAGAKAKYKDKTYHENVKELMQDMKDTFEKYKALKEIEIYNLAIKAFPNFRDLVEAHKKNYGILDFFDCLYKVKIGLKNNEALRKLIQQRFSMIIVDEFQDSDPLQVDIAFMLAEDDFSKLFFVGDPKQSIFGFARADISVYQGVMDRVAKLANGEVMDLTTNFRSSPLVLNFVNENFKQILLRDKSQPDITVDYEAMDVSPENEKAPGGVIKWQLQMEKDTEELETVKWREREAFCVASKIKQMLDNGYKAGDFFILFFRSTSMAQYESALDKLDIPVINTKSKNFLSKAEVIDMLNIISHVAFPTDKYFMACAENSVLIKQMPEEILKSILESEMSLMMKLEDLFDLCELKEASLQKGSDKLLQLKINLMSLLESELDVTGFDLKQTIHNLFKKATDDSFIDSIKLNDQSIYVETTKPNAVKLMTIHAAKGLESRVVIISAHTKPKELKGAHFIDRENDSFYPNCDLLPSGAAKVLELNDLILKLNYIDRKKKEEERRVLYVAATRAIETLIILDWPKARSEFMTRLMGIDGIKFTDTVEVKFDDFEKEFDKYLLYRKAKIHKIEASYSPKLIKTIQEEKLVSKAVTHLISDKELFKNIDGRKWGMEFGTLTHKVMEAISQHLFLNQNTKIEVEKLISHFQNETEASFAIEDIDELKVTAKSFLSSPLSSEIMAADEISTEIPFVLEGAYHGIIDLLILKGEQVKVVDWKSDRLHLKKDEIKNHYKKQIQLYVEAINQIRPGSSEGECVFLFEK